MTGTEENYIALLVSIIKNTSIDEALHSVFREGAHKPNMGYVTDKAECMREMKRSGMTYQQIGDQYGVNPGTVYRHINGQGRKH